MEHLPPSKRPIFKKVVRQNALIALGNVREFYCNMEQYNYGLPSALETSLVNAIGLKNLSEVERIMGDTDASIFPFKDPATLHPAAAKNSLMTFLLSLHRNSLALPTEIKYKILGYCPELLCNQYLFAHVFPHALRNGTINECITHCPLEWFTHYYQIKTGSVHALHIANTISLHAANIRYQLIYILLPKNIREQLEQKEKVLINQLFKKFQLTLTS